MYNCNEEEVFGDSSDECDKGEKEYDKVEYECDKVEPSKRKKVYKKGITNNECVLCVYLIRIYPLSHCTLH